MANRCKTYLTCTGDFDPVAFALALNVIPHEFWAKEELRRDGEPYSFSRISFSLCEEYDVDLSVMAAKSIAPFAAAPWHLKQLCEEYGADLSLVVVPYIDAQGEEPTPIMPTEREILAFCHESGAYLDIDYYIV